MLAKRIIPCLDVNAGRVVKGVKFIGLRDAGDPVEVARIYDREGADELCFLDITASYENREIILDVVSWPSDIRATARKDSFSPAALNCLSFGLKKKGFALRQEASKEFR